VTPEVAESSPSAVLEDDFTHFAGFVAAIEEEQGKDEESEED
jgi:hypothetical protein